MFGVTTAGGHRRAGGAGAPRLRGARLPRHRHRRPEHGEPGRGRAGRRRPRPDDDGARRRPGRRRAVGRAAPAGGRRPARACRRSSRSARWTWSTSARATRCPSRFADRHLYVHNPSVTLMRTTPEECAELGRRLGAKLSAATGPVALFVPLRGISAICRRGRPVLRPGRRRGAARRRCARRSRRRSRCTRSTRTSTTRPSPSPWRRGSTSSWEAPR